MYASRVDPLALVSVFHHTDNHTLVFFISLDLSIYNKQTGLSLNGNLYETVELRNGERNVLLLMIESDVLWMTLTTYTTTVSVTYRLECGYVNRIDYRSMVIPRRASF